ncbi:protein fantom [Parambassis ranga]|uniref:Protein fantom n=1 Tax=Parambassis ranga TaxID=210632 RepID=A0A6P7KKF8_9TELE|nr:protein fantom [Parambassis ranga]
MSTLFDVTAADVPVKDIGLSRPAAPQDSSAHQYARARHDVSRVSREELEDRYLCLSEETLHLKQHIHKQEDKIRKLGTKLMRLVKDRGRMEQLAAGGGTPLARIRDVEMEEMMEELQEKVRSLQYDNEGLRQRLLVAKQQLINSQSHRQTAYSHVKPRINTGLKRLRDNASSPSQARPKSSRSLDRAGRPPIGQLPRYGHSLLEEARAKIRNLENVIESQRIHMEELEGAAELLREELRIKEASYEERLLQVRQQQNSKLRSHVSSNVMMVQLQKQLADRSNAVTELEGRFLQLQESQQTLKVSHDAAMLKVDELSAQLKDERLKALDLEKRLQSAKMSKIQTQQLKEQISELEQERDVLKDNNETLLTRAFDVSQQQKWQLQEQQLKLQIAQLETALKADLVDKNEILDKIKAERDTNENLTEENKKLQIQFLEQKQQLEEANSRLKFYSREGDYDVAELTEALLLIKTRKSQQSGDLGFLKEVEEDTSSSMSARELRAAHAETIQELQKTRNLLSMESRISRDYKVELEAAMQKMEADKAESEQKLERQAQLLDARAAKIKKLEAQLRDIAYGTKTYVLKPDISGEEEADDLDETLHLKCGENLLELQIVGISLSPAALEALGDTEPSTFCTYSFYLFDLHSTPVVTGRRPQYGFTSKYVVSMEENFLDYLWGGCVTVELHQALGLDWRTLATAQLRLQPLMEQDGKLHGSATLAGTGEDARSFGSLDYWLRLRIPMTETLQLYRDKVKAVGYVSSALTQQLPSSSSWNELLVTIQRCTDLRSRSSQHPSPYVIYKFFDFPDCPTSTVHDCCDPQFNDCKSYSVRMDADLHCYLKSDVLQFYVFDYREEQMDTYLGKARVPLLSLSHDQSVTGVFPLADPSGQPAGHMEVTLKWKFTYLPPSEAIMADEEPPAAETVEQKPEQHSTEATRRQALLTDEEEELHRCSSHPEAAAKVLLPKLIQRAQPKDAPPAKRVTFGEATAADKQVVSTEQEDEEQSCVSDGQLVPANAQSSDDSEISEDIVEDVEEVRAAAEDQSESTDSDDCIVHGPAAGRKPSERVRVEVVSLSLRPDSWVAQDSSVMRLFVEYSFLDLPTEETPLSLPKPPPGKSINYNYSKVIPVDVQSNAARRHLLRGVLQGRNPQMERIRFTVVSEPPEAEEQERECEDVGVAFLRINKILERQQDVTEAILDVLDMDNSSEVVGSLTVSVEGLEALQSIMKDQDVSAQLPSA